MALHPVPSVLLISNCSRQLPPRSRIQLGISVSVPPTLPRIIASNSIISDQTIVRRSADYKPPIWDNDYLQSLTTEYGGSYDIGRVNKLKAEVRMMLETVAEPLDKLELIDNLQKLGLSYHFQDQIKGLLNFIYNSYMSSVVPEKGNLYAVALQFRLLRQHGYNIPQERFKSLMDESGNLKASHSEDVKGMLSLYEASYLLIEGESMLEEARAFTTKHLEEFINQNNINEDLSTVLVSHALELPLHWRMPRLEARWFIDVYEKKHDMNPILLELAKLDFNMVQAIHQEDLKHVSSWWKNTRLGEKLSFARDRLMENFFWTVGVIFEPQFGCCRRMLTKVNALITTIDDVYDVYGTLDELELFTDSVERWDVNAMEQLPDYMKICFLCLYNTTNEMAFDVLKEQGCHVLPYLKKAWADLCKSYLLEAKWYFSGYKPTLQEYLDNAWISISAPVILVHAYFLVSNPISNEALECLEKYPDIIRWSSMILRLADDLGTSSYEIERGDVPKSIQCYMYETGASEEEAREHIRFLIGETWKKMNEDGVADSTFSQTFIGIAMNLARMAQCMYQYGDGHAIEDGETRDCVLSLLIHPIPPSYRDKCA